jgi:hypothetical protein
MTTLRRRRLDELPRRGLAPKAHPCDPDAVEQLAPPAGAHPTSAAQRRSGRLLASCSTHNSGRRARSASTARGAAACLS